MNEKEWYSVKGLFRWYLKESGETAKFEDRIIRFRADSFEEAIRLAEKEAEQYCKEDPTANFNIESLGIWDACSTAEVEDGTEVYSQLFHSDLSSKEYIKKYYPKSEERN